MTTRSPKTRIELHQAATALAQQYRLVLHNSQLFVPANWLLPVIEDEPPEPTETIWLPMTAENVLEFGNIRGRILFQNTTELVNFTFMLKQEAQRPDTAELDRLLIKTSEGLRVLASDGTLQQPSGAFIPNTLWPVLPASGEENEAKEHVWSVLVDWLGAEEPAHSLLYHLATTLAPGWSASKIVLLLGSGRNGKSTLLKMVEQLLGSANVSHVTRQQIAAKEPAIVDLNNKLANIVYDGEATYLKDSSTEKTLVVGEPVGVRLLYENTNTSVSTNGLFLEGLNEEPKSRDKTNALQRRIVRFFFSKEYPLDRAFEEKMLSEEMIAGLLSLLLDHYVTADRQAELLQPSQASYDLQIEQLWTNSRTFQYLRELVMKDPSITSKILGMDANVFAEQFQAWLISGKDDYSVVDAYRMLKECYVLKRKSVRSGRQVKKTYVIEDFTPDAKRMIEQITEEGETTDGVLDETELVGD